MSENTQVGMPDDRMAIVLKTGMPIWVSNELGMKIRAQLATQDGHGFLTLRELGGRTINTSSIDDVCTALEYEDHQRTKQGEWQCAWKKWHPKKGECQCRAEAQRAERDRLEKARRDEDNKPLTEEERARNAESFRKSNETYALDNPQSVFRNGFRPGSRSGKKMRRSTILEWEQRTGQEANVEDLAIDEDVI